MGRRIGRHPSACLIVVCTAAAILAVSAGTSRGGSQSTPASDITSPADAGASPLRGTSPAELVKPPTGTGLPRDQVWYGGGPAPRGPGGGVLLYDNGAPLADVNDPASQLSLAADGADDLWQFRAASTDDFFIEDFVNPNSAAHITLVRAPFALFPDSENDSPLSLWTGGVYVVVWPNNPLLNTPQGLPQIDPTNPAATTPVFVNAVDFDHVPLGLLTETLVDDICRPCYVLEIPVDLIVAKNTQYWLSIIPRHPAPPQSFWCLSDMNTGFNGHWGFEQLGIAFWEVIPGNVDHPNCPDAPPAGTALDLSFQLFGGNAIDRIACCNEATGVCRDILAPDDCFPEEVATFGTQCQFIQCDVVSGACCDDVTGLCSNGVLGIDCQGPDQRFAAGQTCEQLDPVCGTTELGACCLPSGVCSELTPAECSDVDGDWTAGTCELTQCPPSNDVCVDATVVTQDGVYSFSTLGATTDGDPVPPPCATPQQDIWFRYIANCDGVLFLSTCFQSQFDSVIAVYEGCFCDQNQGPLVTCNNDGCNQGVGSTATLAVQANACYLIRVGGVGAAAGSGTLTIGCVPVNLGACCMDAGGCELTDSAECLNLGGTFHSQQPCSPAVCPAPINDDCAAALPIGPGSRAFDTSNATTDGPAGPHGGDCGTIDQDIWYAFTATCDGTLVASLCGPSAFDSTLAIYEGCGVCPPAAGPIGCDNDGCGLAGGSGELSVPASAGQCYLIRVGGNNGEFGPGALFVDCIPVGQGACCHDDGTCDVVSGIDCSAVGDLFFADQPCTDATCPEPPPNDMCENAFTILDGVTLFSTLRATTDGPDDSPGGLCNDVNQDIWYRYTATCDGDVVVSLCLDTSYDASLALYDGFTCPPAGLPVACDDDGCGALGGPGRTRVAATIGQQILIRVGGPGTAAGNGAIIVGCVPANQGACCTTSTDCQLADATTCASAGGEFFLGELCEPLPCTTLINDDCAGAFEIFADPVPFDTTEATTDGPLDSPGGICTNVDNDVWFLYQAPCSGILNASLCSATAFDAALAIYDACGCPANSPPVACDNDACGGLGSPAEVELAVTQGACYLIRVGGHDGARGSGTITMTCTAVDLCCPGDANLDNVLDELDAAALVPLLLNPPLSGEQGYCQADVNGDDAVNGEDVVAFVDRLLSGVECPPINQPTGACCSLDGSCTVETQLNCLNLDGAYSGNGTGCDPNECPQPQEPPVNDACVNALPLTCNSATSVDNTLGETEPGDPSFECAAGGGTQGAGSVWYTFIATDTSARISTCGSTGSVTNTLIAVYEGGCPADGQAPIACSDDPGGACGQLAQVCVDGLTIDEVYTVEIASFDNLSRGNISVDLRCPCPIGACCLPDGSCSETREDACLEVGGTYHGDNVTCTPNPCPPPPILSCCAGDLDGNGVTDDLDADGFVAAILSPPLAGTPQFCRADMNLDGTLDGNDVQPFTEIALTGSECTPPAADACTTAPAIACGERMLIDNTHASEALDDPAFSCLTGGPGPGVGTVWFSFEATSTEAHITTCDSLSPVDDTLLAVYSGDCPPAALTELGCSDNGLECAGRGELCVTGLTPGVTYYILAASADIQNLGFVSVELQCQCPTP